MKIQNVHKLVYLAGEYPDRTIRQLAEMFQISVLEMNSIIWKAKDLGYLYVDDITGNYKVEKKPKKWDFGPEVDSLVEIILYTFDKIAEKESDLEENQFGLWASGFPLQDQAVAMKSLLNDGKLATYKVTDIQVEKPSKKGLRRGKQPKVTESEYTFYCLPKNLGKEWGKKQFKNQESLSKSEDIK